MSVDICLLYPVGMPDCFCHSIPCLLSYLDKQGFVGVEIKSVDDIGKYAPRFVGVSIPFTYLADAGKQLIAEVRQKYPGIPVVVGGVHVSMCPDEFADVDFVCVGEGEQFVVDVLTNSSPSDVVVSLDELELPLWSKPPVVVLQNGMKALVYSGSRGCPFNCGFCSNHVLSKQRVRYRSVDKVVHDVQVLKRQYGCGVFEFRDETFTIDADRVIELCHRLKPLGIRWWCQTRCNLVSPDVLQVMRESGCVGISLGIESGVDDILDKVRKGITTDEIRQAVSYCKDAGLFVYGGFIVGFPWDTIDTVEATARFAQELPLDTIGCSVMCPYPGTLVREVAQQEGGILSDDWSKYHSGCVVYQPPGLKGFDMRWLQRYVENQFYSSSRQRLINQGVRMWKRQGWKPKVDMMLRMWRWYLPSYMKNKKDLM